MKHLTRLLLALTLTLSMLTVLSARGATNIVTSAADDGGAGTLRGVIASSIPGDTIIFTNTLSGSTIVLTSGQLLLDKNLTIDTSALAVGVTLFGGFSTRIFLTLSNTTNVLTALTIIAGNAPEGGGIYNAGTLSVNRCSFSGNAADGGGAIFNASTLTVNQCNFSGNSSYGAGIFNTGTLIVNQSTLSGNVASFSSGAGIYNLGTLSLNNSIVAGNTADVDPNIFGLFSGSNNLTVGDPLLAPLGSYGGPTQTMPPLPGSPAIDGCTNGTSFATDQRGLPRIVGAFADIGAVEGVFNPNFPLINPAAVGNGAFQFSFTNLAGASFTIFASTNVALPLAQWSNLGAPVESPAGTFQFTDPQATNNAMRFYRVTSP